MANIHAINAQGIEYGITAENGISQAQASAITTIGNVADLTTTDKTTLVSAVNEVNGKFPSERVLYENQSPESSQAAQSISVSELGNAKALRITYGSLTNQVSFLKEETFPLSAGKGHEIYLSQVQFDAEYNEQQILARRVILNTARRTLFISGGTLYTRDPSSGTSTMTYSADSAKVVKVVAIF